MKLGRRCSLCGGRLDSSLRCTECGLDNTKNDKMYKNMINQNECQNQPLTHVHEYKENKKTVVKPYGNKAKPVNTKAIISIIFAVIMIFSSVIPVVFSMVENVFSEVIPEYIIDEDEYYGEYYEWYLDNGFYEIGVQLPAGTYTAWVPEDEYGSVNVYEFDGQELMLWDSIEFGIYDGWEQEVELEEGQYINISAWSTVVFGTDNNYEYSYNNIVVVDDQECYDAKGQMIAGEDFPAGVYDICFYDSFAYGSGNVFLDLMSPDGESFIWSDVVHFGSEGGIVFYQGFPFTPGSMITVEDGLDGVTLEPTYEIGQEMYDITWGSEQ